MIEYIKGTIDELTPATVTIDTAGGVGYLLNISLATYTALQQMPQGDPAAPPLRIWVHESIREDAYQLFGFADQGERTLFRQLVGVSGVGPNMARMILSSVSPDELAVIISSGDVKRLKTVKGIGAKTAERIIVDLRDKVMPATGDLTSAAAAGPVASETFDEALTALVVLGYARPAAQKVLRKLFEADPAIRVETAIRKSLAML